MAERKDIHEDEIDLIHIGNTVWAGRKFIAKVTAACILLGLLIAVGSKVEYEASCKLLPESQETDAADLSSLAGLAGLAGINFEMGSANVLSPDLYPEIVNSMPFQLKISSDTIRFENEDIRTTSFLYFRDIDPPSLFELLIRYTLGLPSQIKKLFQDTPRELPDQSGEFIRLTKEDWEILEKFKDRINIEIDNATGMISVTVEMPDPLAAAELGRNIVNLLTKEVISYKVEKVKTSLEFIQASYKQAKQEFEKTQELLAQARDKNRNVSSDYAKIQFERLELENNIAFEVYKGLASQVEQAKIKLKEETPVFTVLEPVRIPEDKSSPKRGLILISFTFLGLFGSFGILVLKALFLKNP